MSNIVIEKLYQKSVEEQKTEFVERKGIGHPDFLIDTACEAVSVALSKYYLDNFGQILHHNVDKGLLVGGRANPFFGGGIVEEPIYILIAGRVTTEINYKNERNTIPYGSLIISSIKQIIKENFRFLDPDKHVIIDYKVKPGSRELKTIVESKEKMPLANDTSYGVGFAPLSKVEKLVYNTERLINSKEFKSEIPESGEDCKVMGVRNKDKIVLTIADGIVSHLTPDLDHYISVKEEIREKVLDLACKLVPDKEIEVYINTADIITKDPKKSKVYLTVTGTSAEAGDDGNTGRGNRANGLITPARQMSLEACAGKNPVSHVGKIYNVAAELIAKKIYEEVKGIQEAYVKLVSQIGKPIDKPLLSSVQLITENNISFRSIKYEVKEIVKSELKNITNITQLVLNRKVQLF